MKTLGLKQFFAGVLALAVFLTASPAFALACLHSKTGSNLACLKLCKHSSDLLTQAGRLPSVGAQACVRASLQDQLPAMLVGAVKAPVPVLAAFVAPVLVAPAPLSVRQVMAALRAPPKPYLEYSLRSMPLGLAPPQA